MTALLLSKPETAFAARGSQPTEDTDPIGVRRLPVTPVPSQTLVAPVRPGPLASFARFVLFGGGVGVLSSAAVAGLAGVLPWALANAVITVASTLLCTELHARFTFGAGRHAEWRQHWQSAGSAAAAYAVTSVAILVLHLLQSSPGLLTEQIVYLSASGLAGIGRFLLLRLFVFASGRNRIDRIDGIDQIEEPGGTHPRPSTTVPEEQNQPPVPEATASSGRRPPAFRTWRSPASPRNWRTASTRRNSPRIPGCWADSPPPSVLTGSSPPTSKRPFAASTNGPPRLSRRSRGPPASRASCT